MNKIRHLSAVVLTKNEQASIGDCLQRLQFCNEIVVIDDNSQDKTIDMVRAHGATVYRQALNNDFSAQRQFGLEKARNPWILFIDADEKVSPALALEIKQVLSQRPSNEAYLLRRRDIWWGTQLKHGEVASARSTGLIRLVKKGSGRWVGKVHETYQTEKSVGRLKAFLDHYPHPSVADFLKEINYYSSLRAKELFERGKKTSILEIVGYPLVKFIWNYLVKLGFLDGAAGFTYAFMMSFHSYLVRSKLYQYHNIDKSNQE